MRKVTNMALDEFGLPVDLGTHAWDRLGRYRLPVRRLVRRLNRIHWMEHAGEPAPWDETVVRVRHLEEAKRVRDETLRPLVNTVWQALEEIGRAAGRLELMQAAEDYWIAEFDPQFDQEPSYTHNLLLAPIHSDLVGALREIVLDDVVSIRFFRESITWYERGHWRCGIREDGRRVVW